MSILDKFTYAAIASSLLISLFNVIGIATNMEPPSSKVWCGIYAFLFVLCFVALQVSV